MLARIALGTVGSFPAISTANAQWLTSNDTNLLPVILRLSFEFPEQGFIAALIIAAAVYLYEYVTSHTYYSDDEDNDSSADIVERHNNETARLQALGRQTDAHTELVARLIDKERIDAEYSEIKQITAHDREVRDLRRKN